jgi:hypothetical protein
MRQTRLYKSSQITLLSYLVSQNITDVLQLTSLFPYRVFCTQHQIADHLFSRS